VWIFIIFTITKIISKKIRQNFFSSYNPKKIAKYKIDEQFYTWYKNSFISEFFILAKRNVQLFLSQLKNDYQLIFFHLRQICNFLEIFWYTTIFVTHGHSNLFSNFSGLKFIPSYRNFFHLKLQQNICQPFFQRKKEHTKKNSTSSKLLFFGYYTLRKYYKIPSVNEAHCKKISICVQKFNFLKNSKF